MENFKLNNNINIISIGRKTKGKILSSIIIFLLIVGLSPNLFGNGFSSFFRSETYAESTSDWVYYTASSSLYKVKVDGTGYAHVIDNSSHSTVAISDINIAGDGYIYYSAGSDVYKVKVDGTGYARVIDNYSHSTAPIKCLCL